MAVEFRSEPGNLTGMTLQQSGPWVGPSVTVTNTHPRNYLFAGSDDGASFPIAPGQVVTFPADGTTIYFRAQENQATSYVVAGLFDVV